MKTRRSGSRSGCAARHAFLCAATSGRSCSLACAVFFEGLAAPVEKAPDDAWRKSLAMRPLQAGSDLHQRDVDCRRDQLQDLIAMGFDAPGAPVATLRTRCARARFAPALRHLNGGRGRDTEAIGGRPATHALLDRLHKAIPKVFGQRFGHGRRPPPPAPSMNHCSWTLGIPCDSVRMENALVE